MEDAVRFRGWRVPGRGPRGSSSRGLGESAWQTRRSRRGRGSISSGFLYRGALHVIRRHMAGVVGRPRSGQEPLYPVGTVTSNDGVDSRLDLVSLTKHQDHCPAQRQGEMVASAIWVILGYNGNRLGRSEPRSVPLLALDASQNG